MTQAFAILPEEPDLSRLTKRQKEVAEWIKTQAPYKQIAYNLGISEKTLSLHAFNIHRKLNLPKRTYLRQFLANGDRL